MTAFPRDWSGRLQATPEQVATADRLIAEGQAAPIDPGEYDPRARTHLQLTRMVGWRSDGKIYLDPAGRIIGCGFTFAEARKNGPGALAARPDPK